MPIFKYKGFTKQGSEITGSIEASNLNEALLKVRSEGIYPSDIADSQSKLKKGFFARSNNALFLENFTRQLSILLIAEVPLRDAIQSISYENKSYYRDILVCIKDRISEGASLYRALQDFKNIFPDYYISMIQAGEQVGNLPDVTKRLADYIENQNRIKSRVYTAMTYPLLMIIICSIVLSFLFTFVIPKIVKVFSETKSSLPFITEVLIALSNLFVNYWWLMLIIVISAYISVREILKKQRLLLDRILLKIPGNLLQSLYYSRFTRTLAFLLEGGIPLLKALDISAHSTGNKELEKRVFQAKEKVSEGQRLSASLQGLPPFLLQLISIGEKSGKLTESLKKAADSYDMEFNRRITRAIAVLEPLLIVIMGAIVFFIVLAVLLPIFQLNQLIK
ncbi:MAG: type II secretion system F family protein [Thermodesulfovibrionales bacterium]|nr:type II secretion system F family protein [Thermodesulfovibrionales bacterium]